MVERLVANEKVVGSSPIARSIISKYERRFIEKMRKFKQFNNKDPLIAASDAFFPFIDGIEKLVQAGVTAVVQPFGSIKDKEIIKFANEMKIVLVFSKTRHFNH